MASFVILSPPDEGQNNEGAIFIRDGFSFLALLLQLFWLLWHRLWFAAAMLFLVYVGLTAAVDAWPQWSLFAVVASLSLAWFVALEGNAMRVAKKERQGWQIVAIVEAQDAATAEEMFYADDEPTQSGVFSPSADNEGEKRAVLKPSRNHLSPSGPALGLLDLHGKH